MSRIVRFHEFGEADVLKIEERQAPAPAAGEVLVGVEAVGVSWYDVLWRQNLANTPTQLPAGLGHELAGVVLAVGDGVTDLAVGDRVASSRGTAPTVIPVMLSTWCCHAAPWRVTRTT